MTAGPIHITTRGNSMRLLPSIAAILVTPELACGTLRAAEPVVLVTDGNGEVESPFGVDFDRDGNLYLVELTGHRVKKIDRSGNVTTIAGTGRKGEAGDGGPAAEAELNGPHALALAPNGDIYVADTWNNRVRRIEAKTGRIGTFAGTGEKGFSGDGGPAREAQFGGIYCIAFDPSFKTLYLADLDNRRIRAIDMSTGIVATVAGNGERGVPKDGSEARSAPLIDPRAVAADANGNVYVLERGGHALRVVDGQGTIRTVAGTGERGAQGDGGPALEARLNGPKHLCVDEDGSIVIADTENHVIRRYIPNEGRIERVAGTGKKGTAGPGRAPLEIELNQPHGVYLHPAGDLYISDSSNNRILRIPAPNR